MNFLFMLICAGLWSYFFAWGAVKAVRGEATLKGFLQWLGVEIGLGALTVFFFLMAIIGLF